MATGRIGVTPTLGVRWSKAPAGGTTSLSGLDDNSVSLVYSVGYEQVYRNGVLLSRTNDYTATNGTSITLVDATIAGDIIEVFAQELVPLTDAISKGQFNAKGALLSATAASTPGVLAVGSNDQVLTADSTTSTGLKWATPAAGGMTLLSTTTLSGASTTISAISGSYINLFVTVTGITTSTGAVIRIDPNGVTNLTYGLRGTSLSATLNTISVERLLLTGTSSIASTGGETSYAITFHNYTSATNIPISVLGSFSNASDGFRSYFNFGSFKTTSALSSLVFSPDTGTFSGGTVKIYGVK